MRTARQVNGTGKEGPFQGERRAWKKVQAKYNKPPARSSLGNLCRLRGGVVSMCVLGGRCRGEGSSWSWGQWGWQRSSSLFYFILRTMWSNWHDLICSFKNLTIHKLLESFQLTVSQLNELGESKWQRQKYHLRSRFPQTDMIVSQTNLSFLWNNGNNNSG